MKKSFIERFWSKVDIRGEDECWNWNAVKDKDGYGYVVSRKAIKAHRLSYMFCKGDIPFGLEIDHLCRNHGCVNPNHLECVTHNENMTRYFSTILYCKRGHALPDPKLIGKYFTRHCLICQKTLDKSRYEKGKLLHSSLVSKRNNS